MAGNILKLVEKIKVGDLNVSLLTALPEIGQCYYEVTVDGQVYVGRTSNINRTLRLFGSKGYRSNNPRHKLNIILENTKDIMLLAVSCNTKEEAQTLVLKKGEQYQKLGILINTRAAKLQKPEVAKLSKIIKRREYFKPTDVTPRPVLATNIFSGEELEFCSIHAAARYLNIPPTNICRNLKGYLGRAGAYTFSYLDQQEAN